jgi:hypothetical protein
MRAGKILLNTAIKYSGSTGTFHKAWSQPVDGIFGTHRLQWTEPTNAMTASVRERKPSSVALTSPGTSSRWLAPGSTRDDASNASATGPDRLAPENRR